jgi:dihydropteroate synthase
MIAGGAAIIDVGGESTRPGSQQITADDEVRRVVPVIEAIGKRFDIPISIDTTKADVAAAAVDAGAEIVNDISGLRFDEKLGAIAAQIGSGLVLMHSRGPFEMMHSQPPVDDLFAEVTNGLRDSIGIAKRHGVGDDQIVVDPGIGFGKAQEQNLELLAKLGKLICEFETFPVLVGISRKSLIGRLLGGMPVGERLSGSVAAAIIAVQNGAKIVRVHDVKETVAALRTAAAIEASK